MTNQHYFENVFDYLKINNQIRSLEHYLKQDAKASDELFSSFSTDFFHIRVVQRKGLITNIHFTILPQSPRHISYIVPDVNVKLGKDSFQEIYKSSLAENNDFQYANYVNCTNISVTTISHVFYRMVSHNSRDKLHRFIFEETISHMAELEGDPIPSFTRQELCSNKNSWIENSGEHRYFDKHLLEKTKEIIPTKLTVILL